MAADATIQLEVKLENGQFKVSSKQVKDGIDGIDKNTEKASANMGKMAIAMGAASLAGAKLISFFKNAVTAASNLQEQTSKFRTVFKGNLDVANKSISDLTNNYAMSTREARQYLASVQDLLVPMGMNSDLAAQYSDQIVKLSADLGSFNNLPTSQVMMDIQSALVGNFETMKKYGVVLNETTLKQKAMTLGVWDGKGVLDAATKAQVAFKLVLEGTKAAQGDMTRTSASYANTMKRMQARTEDFMAEAGKPLMNMMAEMGNSVSLTTSEIKYMGAIVGEVGAAITKLIIKYNPLVKMLEYSVWAIQKIKNAVGIKGAPTPETKETPIPKYKKFKISKGTSLGGDKGGKAATVKDDPELLAFGARMDALRNYYDLKYTAAEEQQLKETELQNQAADDYEAYLNNKLMLDTTYARGVMTLTNTASIFMAQKNTKFFRFGQALAIGQAWINTFLAVTKVLSQLGIFGPAAAGVIITAGALQTKKIASQQPPKYETGEWEVPNTGPAIIHKGEMILNKPTADMVRSAASGQTAGNTTVNNYMVKGDDFVSVMEKRHQENANLLGGDFISYNNVYD